MALVVRVLGTGQGQFKESTRQMMYEICSWQRPKFRADCCCLLVLVYFVCEDTALSTLICQKGSAASWKQNPSSGTTWLLHCLPSGRASVGYSPWAGSEFEDGRSGVTLISVTHGL